MLVEYQIIITATVVLTMRSIRRWSCALMQAMVFFLAYQCTLVCCSSEKRLRHARTAIYSSYNPPGILHKGPRKTEKPQRVHFYHRMTSNPLPSVVADEHRYTVPEDYYKTMRNMGKARARVHLWRRTSNGRDLSVKDHALTRNFITRSDVSISGSTLNCTVHRAVPRTMSHTVSRFSALSSPSMLSPPSTHSTQSRTPTANYSQKERSKIKKDPEETSSFTADKAPIQNPTSTLPPNSEPKKKPCGCAECLGEVDRGGWFSTTRIMWTMAILLSVIVLSTCLYIILVSTQI
jgi:hypothetical protein